MLLRKKRSPVRFAARRSANFLRFTDELTKEQNAVQNFPVGEEIFMKPWGLPTELDLWLVEMRTKGGQRRYTLEHLFVIDEIKRLKAKGLSLTNIRKELDNRYNSYGKTSNPEKIDHLANQIADLVKSTVHSFLEEKS